MDYPIRKKNWHMDIAYAIELASNGDRILCHTESMVELGKKAASRMYPDKRIEFEIE